MNTPACPAKSHSQMRLSDVIKFQKALALAASASNSFEAEAAELAVRRLITACKLDPTRIPNQSFCSDVDFSNNELLKKLRDEYHEQHPIAAVARESKRSGLENVANIQFNISGFSKYARHKKKRKEAREPAVQLTRADHENIRLLFNKGLTQSAVNEQLGLRNANSTRAYYLRSGKWVRDSHGLLQWADWVQEFAPTNPQPTEENSEQKESTFPP